MGQAPTSHLPMKDCYSSLPLTRRQLWSIGCRSGLPFFSAYSYLFHGLLIHTLPDVIPPFVQSQSTLCNHLTRRKLSDYPRGGLVWTCAVMAVRSGERSSWGQRLQWCCPRRLRSVSL